MSMSGSSSRVFSITSIPFIPGICRSTIKQSKASFCRAAIAVKPSGHTVTLYPIRGNSSRINSCRLRSSSANNTRMIGAACLGCLSRLIAVTLTSLNGQGNDQLRTVSRSVTLGGYHATVTTDDLEGDTESQTGPAAISPPGKERFEEMFGDFGRHPAPIVTDGDHRLVVIRGEFDADRPLGFHAFQGVGEQIEHHLAD